jgi:hypothetical protein
VAKVAHEYERPGTAALFMGCEPRAGRRHVRVRARRTAADWAYVVKEVGDERYPPAERSTLVMDQLNTHTAAALYEVCPPAEAKRLADQLDSHYTPKHGSWLNMAEIELSVLARQCLDDRFLDQDPLATAVAAWEATRHAAASTIDWRFPTAAARITRKHLYPAIAD